MFGEACEGLGQNHSETASASGGSRIKLLALAGAGALVVLFALGLGLASDDEETDDAQPAPELAEIVQRIGALEQELDTRLYEAAEDREQAMAALEQAQEIGLQEIEQALEAHEEALTRLPSTEHITRVEQRAEDLAAELKALEQKIPGVSEARLDSLDDRLTALEKAPEQPELEEARLLGFEHWAGSTLIILAQDGEAARYRPGEAVGDTRWRVSTVDPEAEVAVLRHRDGTLHALQVEEAHP
ncbi:hypothetical protein CKO15_06350 [Halorhodospira abdelmalekii]|nr:hypothetical protein [Halorhodospira abdelmalekii]